MTRIQKREFERLTDDRDGVAAVEQWVKSGNQWESCLNHRFLGFWDDTDSRKCV